MMSFLIENSLERSLKVNATNKMASLKYRIKTRTSNTRYSTTIITTLNYQKLNVDLDRTSTLHELTTVVKVLPPTSTFLYMALSVRVYVCKWICVCVCV